MSTFEMFFDRLMQHEGGYSNNPADPGGETRWGVTKRLARAYGYEGAMTVLPKTLAEHIANQAFWQVIAGDQLHPALAWQLFDAAYNHGNKPAIRMLQHVLAVTADGLMGPVTLVAAAKADTAQILLDFNAERLAFYTRLQPWPEFGRGWSRRVARNLHWASTDLTTAITMKHTT